MKKIVTAESLQQDLPLSHLQDMMHKPQNKITMDIILMTLDQVPSYTYTIDAQGNYHYTWTGNWNPSQLTQNNTYYYNNYNTYSYNNAYYNNYYNHSYQYNNYTNNSQTATNNYYTGGSGASYSTTSNNVHVTTTAAPSFKWSFNF